MPRDSYVNKRQKNIPHKKKLMKVSAVEFDLAMRVQSAFLPTRCDSCLGAQVAARHLMSQGIGGDYHDFLIRKDGRCILTIGDVLGHELFSALVMSMIYGAVHAAGKEALTPLSIVSIVNHLLTRLNKQLEYPFLMSSLFVGIVEPGGQTMHYANAGHPPPIVQFQDGRIEELLSTCPILGLDSEIVLNTRSLDINETYQILLYTDGLTDARNVDGNFLDRSGVAELLKFVQNMPVEQAVIEIIDQATAFTGGQLVDDITAVMIRFD